jgi:CheY-like chemotaxis protein
MKKILIIEDNADLRENTEEILDLAGYAVISAENGKIGVSKAIKEVPDVIICDIMMPELDGFGVKEMLSENPITKEIPFIFLTAKADKEDLRKGMNLGADDYLTKPFDDLDLLKSIRIRIEKSTLKNISFSKGPKQTFEELLQKQLTNRSEFHYVKKDTLFRQEETASFGYYLKEGKVKSYRINEDGKELIYNIFSSGDFIGFWDILKGSSHTESASCLEDSVLIKIPIIDIQNKIKDENISFQSIISYFSKDIKINEDRLISLAYDSVRMRVAAALLSVHSIYKKQSSEGNFKIQREDLAAIVGTSPESVIRTLSDLKQEKIITILKNEITILDEMGLQHIVN